MKRRSTKLTVASVSDDLTNVKSTCRKIIELKLRLQAYHHVYHEQTVFLLDYEKKIPLIPRTFVGQCISFSFNVYTNAKSNFS